jgi:hemolysin III
MVFFRRANVVRVALVGRTAEEKERMEDTMEYTPAEERINSVTHAVGAVASAAGLAVLAVTAAMHGGWRHVTGFSVFGITMVFLYAASTLYHATSRPSVKKWFRKMDHSAIFLLIAGTYTPFTLVCLDGPLGWTLFGIVWGLAAAGILLEFTTSTRRRKLSIAVYLIMGWICIVALRKLLESLSPQGLALLFIGGLFYTSGVVFYVWKKLPHHHGIWHLFVLGGSAAHYFSVWTIL